MLQQLNSKSLTLLVLLAISLITGCSTLVNKLNPEPPKVTLVGITPVKMEVLQQTFKLTLSLQNPNDFALPIRGMQFSAAINEDDFASGVSNKAVDLPAFGEAEMEVEVRSGLMQIIENLSKLGNAKTLDYSLRGSVKVEGVPVRLNFKEKGTLSQ
ncbi:MAG: LEA type 2 family protein [Granulosicoccaceae bacterium]